jgi:hypothetical protein
MGFDGQITHCRGEMVNCFHPLEEEFDPERDAELIVNH